MAKILVLLLLVTLVNHNADATINTLLRTGELTLSNLADLKIALLRLVQEFFTGAPSGIGSYRLAGNSGMFGRPVVLPGPYVSRYPMEIDAQFYMEGQPRPGGQFGFYGMRPGGRPGGGRFYGMRPGGGRPPSRFSLNGGGRRQPSIIDLFFNGEGPKFPSGIELIFQLFGLGQWLGSRLPLNSSTSVTFNWLDPTTWFTIFTPSTPEYTVDVQFDPFSWETLFRLFRQFIPFFG